MQPTMQLGGENMPPASGTNQITNTSRSFQLLSAIEVLPQLHRNRQKDVLFIDILPGLVAKQSGTYNFQNTLRKIPQETEILRKLGLQIDGGDEVRHEKH